MTRRPTRLMQKPTARPTIVASDGRLPGVAPSLLARGAVRPLDMDSAFAEFERQSRKKKR